MNLESPSRIRRWQTPNVVWAALMTATILTTWVFSKDAVTAAAGTAATLILAAWKVRLILLDFIELRHAPWPLRIVFEAWSISVPAMILGFYLTS